MRLGNIGVGILIASAGAAFIGIGIAVQNHLMDNYEPLQNKEPAAVQEQTASEPAAENWNVQAASGDVDDNGEVNMFDLKALNKYLNGEEESINEKNADMDGNGRIDSDDSAMLKKYILRNAVGE